MKFNFCLHCDSMFNGSLIISPFNCKFTNMFIILGYLTFEHPENDGGKNLFSTVMAVISDLPTSLSELYE